MHVALNELGSWIIDLLTRTLTSNHAHYIFTQQLIESHSTLRTNNCGEGLITQRNWILPHRSLRDWKKTWCERFEKGAGTITASWSSNVIHQTPKGRLISLIWCFLTNTCCLSHVLTDMTPGWDVGGCRNKKERRSSGPLILAALVEKDPAAQDHPALLQPSKNDAWLF